MRQVMEDITVLLFALTFSTAAQAALTPPPSADTCSMKLKTLQFAGTFDWKSARSGKIEKRRFVIGTPAHGAVGTSVAQIWAGNHCQASCSSVDLGTGTTGFSLPISLELQCRGEELGPLSARVAVLWGQGPKSETMLRFGSWVDGYEQAVLQTQVDHFNAPRLAIDR